MKTDAKFKSRVKKLKQLVKTFKEPKRFRVEVNKTLKTVFIRKVD